MKCNFDKLKKKPTVPFFSRPPPALKYEKHFLYWGKPILMNRSNRPEINSEEENEECNNHRHFNPDDSNYRWKIEGNIIIIKK